MRAAALSSQGRPTGCLNARHPAPFSSAKAKFMPWLRRGVGQARIICRCVCLTLVVGNHLRFTCAWHVQSRQLAAYMCVQGPRN